MGINHVFSILLSYSIVATRVHDITTPSQLLKLIVKFQIGYLVATLGLVTHVVPENYAMILIHDRFLLENFKVGFVENVDS